MQPDHRATERSAVTRGDGSVPPRGKRSRCMHSLRELLRQHNRHHAFRDKIVAMKTREERAKILAQMITRLHEINLRLTDVRKFKRTHVIAVIRTWVEDGLAPATLQSRISTVRVFCRWIDKPDLVPSLEALSDFGIDVEKVRRRYVDNRDKSWTGQQASNPLQTDLPADVGAVLRQVEFFDPAVAIQLQLQLAFGLRVKESFLLCPHVADQGSHLDVTRGTKGGRHRTVRIETALQRTTLDKAKQLANATNGSMIPSAYKLKEWRRRFYYITTKVGLTRANQRNPHGLRHERAAQKYETLVGLPPPTRTSKRTDPQMDKLARQNVAEDLGHSRTQISSMYLGSPRLPDAPAASEASQILLPLDQ